MHVLTSCIVHIIIYTVVIFREQTRVGARVHVLPADSQTKNFITVRFTTTLMQNVITGYKRTDAFGNW